MRRRLRKLAIGLVAGVALALILGVASLEIGYQVLLPYPLPERVLTPLRPQVRSALWLDACSTLPARQSFAYPFLASALLARERYAFYLPGHVARLHIASLQEQGLANREPHLRATLRELALATWIARHWTVEETLDAYGAWVYMGDGECGLANAARHYLDRDLADVSPAELALLAAILRSPGALHPACHADRALAARNEMLDRMEGAGVIERSVALQSRNSPLGTSVECTRRGANEGVGQQGHECVSP